MGYLNHNLFEDLESKDKENVLQYQPEKIHKTFIENQGFFFIKTDTMLSNNLD
jgi:hypothetical protein